MFCSAQGLELVSKILVHSQVDAFEITMFLHLFLMVKRHQAFYVTPSYMQILYVAAPFFQYSTDCFY